MGKFLSERVAAKYYEFYASEHALAFLSMFLRRYSSMEELRADHANGVVIVAPGPRNDDNGHQHQQVRIIFSASPLWKNK